jgi:hypothetical protein
METTRVLLHPFFLFHKARRVGPKDVGVVDGSNANVLFGAKQGISNSNNAPCDNKKVKKAKGGAMVKNKEHLT